MLSVIVLAGTLPFIHHAYHIDEPLFLRIAREILKNPGNPYGFDYIWYQDYQPMHEIAAFPPLFPYLLAFFSGGNPLPPEWLIHLQLVPFGLLTVLIFYFVLRQLEYSPLEGFIGASLLAASPSFVVSANLAMPDVPTLFFVMIAFYFSILGWKSNKTGFLLLGGLFLGAAVLTRYNALALVFIFFFLGLTFNRWKKALIPSFLAGLLFCGWLFISKFLWGNIHTQEITSNFFRMEWFLRRFVSLNIHLTLSTYLPFLALVLFWFKGNLKAILAVILLAASITLLSIFYGKVTILRPFPDLIFLGMGLFLWFFAWQAGAEGLALRRPILSFMKSSDSRSFWFFLWALGVLIIPLFYVFFASKYLLLAEPPLILLLLKALHEKPPLYKKICLAFIPSFFVLSLSVAAADFDLANNYKKAVERIYDKEEIKNHPVWFVGHWGWQYYLEAKGAKSLPYRKDEENIKLSSGDIILKIKIADAQPISEWNSLHSALIDSFSLWSAMPIRTMNPSARAGFYADAWGPLPYAFSDEEMEEFSIYQINP